MVVHTPYRTARWPLPWSFSTFDYRELCALLWEQAACPELELETATVTGRDGSTVHTDRGELRAPLIVDALGWRRVLSNATPIQPPNARLSRGLEVHPDGHGEEMELWIDHRYIRAGYGWSFPARDELRVGIGSFWPAHHVKEPTVRLAHDLDLAARRIPGQLDPPPAAPRGRGRRVLRRRLRRALSPAHRRGHPHGALLRARMRARAARGDRRPAAHASRRSPRYGAFSDSHERKYRWLLNVQRAVGQITPSRAMTAIVRAFESRRLTAWVFGHYLAIAPPSFVGARPSSPSPAGLLAVAASR